MKLIPTTLSPQRRAFRWFAFAAFLCVASLAAHAQYRASIQGTVTDTTGAVIPGATLTLTDIGTHGKQVRTSDSSGVYNFNALPPDTFTLQVEKKGFQRQFLDKLELIPEQANAINVQMQVGADTQTIIVDASTQPAIDTETAGLGRNITANEIQHLPAFERDVTSLIQLVPGVLADGSQGGGGGGFLSPGTATGAGPAGSGNLGHSSSIFSTENGASANTNGGEFQNNGYSVDGISTTSAVWGGATVITPSEDSVSSVKIVTNAYDAENGRFNGALTEITSKSGTNQIHGSLFAQIVRPGLNAYQRWNGPNSVLSVNPDGTKKTPSERGLLRDEDRYNQFGGSIGGPIWKNKIFAFFNYEGQTNNNPGTGTGWYDTAAFDALATSGSIASTYLNFKGNAPANSGIVTSTCQSIGLTEGVSCNTVSGGLNIGSPLTSGLGKQDLGYVSSANPGTGSGLTQVADIANYITQNPTSTNFKQYNGRVDADATSKDHLSFAIYWVPSTKASYNGANRGYDLLNHTQVNDAFSLIWNHIFSPTFLNEARSNAAGWRYNENQGNPNAPYGLPQSNVASPGTASLASWGWSAGQHLNQWTYGFKDVATKVFHSQTFKFGVDFTRLEYLSDNIGTPNYGFYNIWDFLNDAPDSEQGSFNNLTGVPGEFRNDNRENMFGAFIQDDWKVTPKLTFNIGLRYSYFGALTDKDGHMGVVQFGTGSSFLTGLTIHQGVGAWKPQHLNFGPQVGFNYSPDLFHDKLVVSGGYGLNYNEGEIATDNAADGNPPGAGYYNFTSTGPTGINPFISYAVSSSSGNINGYPPNPHAVTSYNSAGLPIGGGASLGAVVTNRPTEYSNHYSLTLQYDLGHSLVADLGYVGSTSRHLYYNYDSTALAAIQGYAQNPLVPNGINTFGAGGGSNNNMMLAGLKHQFSHQFSTEAQFTWGKSMDTGSGPYARDAYLQNPGFYSYGRSDFDVNKAFKLFGVWQPVLFHGGHEWAEKVAGGWTLSGIMSLHSGFGWTPVYNIGGHQPYCSNCGYGYTNLRPYYLGGAGSSTSNNAFKTGSNFAHHVPNSGNATSYLDNEFLVPDYVAALADGTTAIPATTTTGLLPAPGIVRNSFAGPGYRNVDFTIAKAFGFPNTKILGKDARLEIKANIYNAFNLLNISPTSLSANIQNSNLGQAGSALGSRSIDFQARFSF
ncbi:TonB-dependent receptor [Granulicella sp. S156]|uniref:TonB-dependent receptor n=1 Tax=Granulicella sp. S156 TaxID=1747224 RepID=UPI00131CC4F1|nr:TonB-dependent receptor [Granulicella sp. S156]